MTVTQFLFVGEARSSAAKRMGVTWKDGRLAAKQLFDALTACGIDPHQHEYVNCFEGRGKLNRIRRWGGVVVAMGKRVGDALDEADIRHIKIIHPAARGSIRRKDRYAKHIRLTLASSLVKGAGGRSGDPANTHS